MSERYNRTIWYLSLGLKETFIIKCGEEWESIVQWNDLSGDMKMKHVLLLCDRIKS